MVCRAFLLFAIAFVAASLTTQEVGAFSTAPERVVSSTSRGLLKGASSPSPRSTSTSNTELYAVKKATKKKSSAKKSAKKSAEDKEEVVNLKKAEFVAAVAEKTGMTKAESDMALAAVLNVIATVSGGTLV